MFIFCGFKKKKKKLVSPHGQKWSSKIGTYLFSEKNCSTKQKLNRINTNHYFWFGHFKFWQHFGVKALVLLYSWKKSTIFKWLVRQQIFLQGKFFWNTWIQNPKEFCTGIVQVAGYCSIIMRIMLCSSKLGKIIRNEFE